MAFGHESAVGFLGAIWNLYLGLLTLLGNFVLVVLGIGMCAYATYEQMQPLHNTTLDVVLILVGILLIGLPIVRRMVWAFCGLAAVWCGLIWVVMQFILATHEKLVITPELIAVAAIPPFFMTFYLEAVRKRGDDLEISLTEKPRSDD
jgi:hypothetical protein